MVGLLKRLCERAVSAVGAWDQFWFAPLDPSSLGLIRILSGLMLLYTHCVWGLRLDAFFGPDGWQDATLVQMQDVGGLTRISFWWYVDDAWRWPVHYLCLAVLAMYTVGCWTRVTSWLAFFITISYANRVLNANFGLDQINAFLTFYLAFGPCGAAFSVDRWWALRKRRRKATLDQRPFVASPLEPHSMARLSSRMIQVHLCLLYFFAGVSKLKGEAWWNGDAVWMALANEEYQSADLTWLAWYPWVSYLLTHVTVLWEMSFFVTVWNRSLRPFVLLIGCGVHLGIGAFLGMWTFGLIMIVAYISFLPPEWVQRGVQWWTNRSPMAAFVGGPLSRGPAESPSIAVRTAAGANHWWPQYRNVTFTAWPFAPSTELNVDAPRVVLVHPEPELRRALETDLRSSGFPTTSFNNITEACIALEQSPADALFLVGRTDEQVSELLDFRRLLLRIGPTAPVSLTLLLERRPYDLRHADDHACIVGQPLYAELRRRLLLTLSERASTPEEALRLRQRADAAPAPLKPLAKL